MYFWGKLWAPVHSYISSYILRCRGVCSNVLQFRLHQNRLYGRTRSRMCDVWGTNVILLLLAIQENEIILKVLFLSSFLPCVLLQFLGNPQDLHNTFKRYWVRGNKFLLLSRVALTWRTSIMCVYSRIVGCSDFFESNEIEFIFFPFSVFYSFIENISRGI